MQRSSQYDHCMRYCLTVPWSNKSHWWWWLFPCWWGLWGKVWWLIPCPRFFFLSEDQLMHTNSTFQARISPQWLSKLRWVWPSVSWWVASGFVALIGSHTMPGQHSQPTLTVFSEVCMYNLPPALLSEWPGSFTCYCSNMGWNRHQIKISTQFTLEKKTLPPLLPGLKLTTFWSRVWHSANKVSC